MHEIGLYIGSFVGMTTFARLWSRVNPGRLEAALIVFPPFILGRD